MIKENSNLIERRVNCSCGNSFTVKVSTALEQDFDQETGRGTERGSVHWRYRWRRFLRNGLWVWFLLYGVIMIVIYKL